MASALGRDDVTACILAGGRARRLGGLLKPLLVVDGETILARQRAVLAPRAAEIVIAVAGPGPLAEQGLRAVVDAVPDAGPLAGLAAGLAASARPWLLAVAGDMPHLAPAVLDALLARAAAAGDTVDAVVPRVNGYPEPLCALYGRGAAPVVARYLTDGRRRTQGILDDLRVSWLDEATLRVLDPGLRTFTNVNEPGDVG
jgi:molybdopterin-guanine dinucleotide biosynthesis protein A